MKVNAWCAVVVASLGLLASAARADPPPGAQPDLRDVLMRKFDAMNAKHEGIFHEDVTSTVQPYFPLGQSIADTRKVIADQKLGALKPFKGTNDPGMGTMYVTRFALTNGMFAQTYVVLDFDFAGAAPDMTLKAVKAFLRASNM